ncbi:MULTISPECIES: GNAT family N-acetyltransferase [Microbacterium]|uniref:GNAT family N-acetyltransferase n=1 Tax=Microbacterium hominis TaxID=162426 RepID=A0A2K9D7Z8_9MICO|nr:MULTISPECIES: GNAT family N-acetyltransferase [Microbacterium]AUG29730.1 GNAT family N-acetyltransferase [Microbacterium hominis]
MILATSRLDLREMTDDDLPALRRILQDPRAMRAYEGAFSEEETRQWLDRQVQRYHDDGHGLWAVVHRDSGEMIGQCGITRQRIDLDEVVEVGYLFERAHWHRGYAVEAASACRDWAFATLPIDELYAKVRATNVASMNVAIRLGMTVRRTFTTHYRGVDMPHLAFAVDRASWRRGAVAPSRADRSRGDVES